MTAPDEPSKMCPHCGALVYISVGGLTYRHDYDGARCPGSAHPTGRSTVSGPAGVVTATGTGRAGPVRDVQLSAFPDIAPDKPVGAIPASVQTGTNADLIAKIAPLYLTGSVLDVTYGEGKWWDRFTPDPFTYHDLIKVPEHDDGTGVDFRNLPHPDRSFDAVCFDPPYIISGGQSATMPEFQNAYGVGGHNLQMTNSEGGNTALHALIRGGLLEAIRVSRRWVLVKCMEFAQGGGVNNAFGSDFHDIPYGVTKWALEAGCRKHDQIVHHAGSGPGGHNIWTPTRARRHHSYLIVFAVPADPGRLTGTYGEEKTP